MDCLARDGPGTRGSATTASGGASAIFSLRWSATSRSDSPTRGFGGVPQGSTRLASTGALADALEEDADSAEAAAGVSAHRERYPGAIRPPPCRPEFVVIGPHPRSSLSSGDSREITIGPVRIVLLVANQPIKDLEPQLGFILTLVGRDRELGEEPAQPPALCTVGQQEPRPRHERVRAVQRLRGPGARPTHCRSRCG